MIEAHLIDIDSIVLSGVDLRDSTRVTALIEGEILRALSGSDLRASTAIAQSETRIAGEVARHVVQSIDGKAQ